jgi:hypothetical protein
MCPRSRLNLECRHSYRWRGLTGVRRLFSTVTSKCKLILDLIMRASPRGGLSHIMAKRVVRKLTQGRMESDHFLHQTLALKRINNRLFDNGVSHGV